MDSARDSAKVLSSALVRSAGFRHGFTTRHGAAADVAASLGIDEGSLFTVSQVHGSAVVVAAGDAAGLRGEKADALVLGEGRAGGVRVADCVPVLVGDTATGRAAAIHAGWRGVVSGVVPAALTTMRGAPRGFVAAIGPCIEACCFEVGEEVADAIELAVPAPGVVARRGGGKAWVDLVAATSAQLQACGVPAGRIERVGGCTRCESGGRGERDTALYHSYRRDGAASGRMIGAIRSNAG